ncbi:hypothetical protein [Actinophytocola sediminis]
MSSRFDRVPLIGTGHDVEGDIASWVTSSPLRSLVEEFGGGAELVSSTVTDLASRLAKLDEFTDRWDTRKGLERNQAGELDLTDNQAQLVLDAADAFGFSATSPPPYDTYDYVLMLGGLVRACVARPAYAAQLINSRQVTARAVVALGGHRPFVGDEFEFAKVLGIPEVTEEYEAMDAGTRLAFGLTEPEKVEGETSELVGGTWGVRHYRTDTELSVMVAAAPSSAPRERRANTPDSYAWFADYLADLRPGQRVLVVTTQIYVPAQHAGAVRMLQLPYGVEVHTVGTEPTVAGAPKQQYSPTKYLLEVRSTVRALRALHATAGSSRL